MKLNLFHRVTELGLFANSTKLVARKVIMRVNVVLYFFPSSCHFAGCTRSDTGVLLPWFRTRFEVQSSVSKDLLLEEEGSSSRNEQNLHFWI